MGRGEQLPRPSGQARRRLSPTGLCFDGLFAFVAVFGVAGAVKLWGSRKPAAKADNPDERVREPSSPSVPASPFRALWCVFGTLAIFALLNLAFDGFPYPFIERESTFRYAIGFVEPDRKPVEHERRYRDWHRDEFGVPAPTGSKSFKAKEFAVDLLLALLVSGGEAWRVGRVSTKRG